MGAALLVLVACVPSAASPTSAVVGDAFFFGQALLDVNRNGQIDSEDVPIPDATFIVTLSGGLEFGAQTDKAGRATIVIPSDIDFPVTVRMEAPKGSALKVVEPSSFLLNETTGEPIRFLFEK